MDQSSRHQQHIPLVRPNWNNSIPELNGIVLAGGESTRMGIDKGSIKYHDKSQREHVFNLLNRFTKATFISTRPGQSIEPNLPILQDTFLNLGPFGGVLSAFRFDPNKAWLAVACDLPLLDEVTIQLLIKERDPEKMATCFHDPATGLPEPLLTIWEPRAYPPLLQFLSQGISCLRKSLVNSDTKQIHISRPEVLKNANTPEEAVDMYKLLSQ